MSSLTHCPMFGFDTICNVGEENLVNCEIPYRLERRTKHSLERVWKPLPNRCVLKLFKRKSKRKSPKRTISTNGGFELALIPFVTLSPQEE